MSDVICPLPEPVDPVAAKAKLREVQARRKSLSPAAQERMAAREYGTDVPSFRAALKSRGTKPVPVKAKTPGISSHLADLPRIAKPTHRNALTGANKGYDKTKRMSDYTNIDDPHEFHQMMRRMNCPHTTAAYEMRRRGFDVVAKASSDGRYIGEMADTWGVKTVHPWKSVRDIDRLTAGDPVGSRYMLNLHWKDGGGHLINAEKMSNGKIRFIDAQGMKDDVSDYFDDAVDGHIFRVDDKEPNKSVLDQFERSKP